MLVQSFNLVPATNPSGFQISPKFLVFCSLQTISLSFYAQPRDKRISPTDRKDFSSWEAAAAYFHFRKAETILAFHLVWEQNFSASNFGAVLARVELKLFCLSLSCIFKKKGLFIENG